MNYHFGTPHQRGFGFHFGTPVQRGAGFHFGAPVQRGAGICRYSQEGNGIGSFLGGIFKRLLPAVKTGLTFAKKIATSAPAKKIASSAADMLVDVAADAVEGKNVKTSIQKKLNVAKTALAQALRGEKKRKMPENKTTAKKQKKPVKKVVKKVEKRKVSHKKRFNLFG